MEESFLWPLKLLTPPMVGASFCFAPSLLGRKTFATLQSNILRLPCQIIHLWYPFSNRFVFCDTFAFFYHSLSVTWCHTILFILFCAHTHEMWGFCAPAFFHNFAEDEGQKAESEVTKLLKKLVTEPPYFMCVVEL